MTTGTHPSSENPSTLRSLLITGASSGIGLATAIELSKYDNVLVFAGVRNRNDIERLESISNRIQPLWLDITSADSISSALETINARGIPLQGLVNNAGFSLACPLEFIPLDEFRRQFEVNVIGQLAVTQAFLSDLRKMHGRIVNITSLSAYVSGPFVGSYAASKHAFASISESMRLELRRQGVRVIQVIPGDIKTPIWSRSRIAAEALRTRLAESLAHRLPDAVRAAYAEDIQAMRAATARFAEEALSVQLVAKAIQAALMSARPRSHYIIGAKAWGAVRLLRFLPASVRDRIILGQLGMKR